jgi:small ligand-binding sensory domain FIST
MTYANTSSRFVSICANGQTWRDICKNALEQYESFKTAGFHPNIGFLYLTEALEADVTGILTLLKSVTGITHWSGTTAAGVCGCGVEYVGQPAISLLMGQIEEDSFRHFFAQEKDTRKVHQHLKPWLNTHDPMLALLHANPSSDHPLGAMIEELDTLIGGFMVGGFTSYQTAGTVLGGEGPVSGLGGYVFSDQVSVAAALSQGYTPMGPLRSITPAGEHIIGSLDSQKPFDVFSQDLRASFEKKLGYQAHKELLEKGILEPDFERLLGGQFHAAFPVAGSDQKDFMLRNILAIDPDSGEMAVNEYVQAGQAVMFVHRDDETMRADLSKAMLGLRERVLHQTGDFKPRAALYISCVARANVDFSGNGTPGGEMALIRDILGDIPLAGFYAAGEISAGRIYAYTGVMVLFL